MADIVGSAVRRKMMSGIRAKDTKPELKIRRSLHARGYRYRLHDRNLPGRPDLVLPRYRCVLFIHGCFWHGHSCPLFRMPATRTEFWKHKIETNRRRDSASETKLVDDGWRVGIVWECALKGPTRLRIDDVIASCEQWFSGTAPKLDVQGI